MCGIAGIVLKTNSTLDDFNERLDAMTAKMIHRGPDDAGHYISPKARVGLGNRRLAIRDLSPAGHMPMTNENKDIWITFNGEIYNIDSLKPALESQGYRFVSKSDTEVILKGYDAWGPDVFARLNGQFAIMIHDQKRDKVYITRDHLGIKPVYYAETSQAIIIASELKAIHASGLVSKTVRSEGLVNYLIFGSVPNPLTIYQEIQALPPATTIEINNAGIISSHHTFWDFAAHRSKSIAPEDVQAVVNEQLNQAVRKRLVSDVPLGAFLSGGVDSSTLVALMRENGVSTIRTCSMVFEEAQYSEASFAREVAHTLGTEHFERTITASDIKQEFENIIYAMDQPSIDGVNTYFVSQTAKQAGLTVTLSGLGGDELFGGYPNTFSGVPSMYKALQIVKSIPGAPQVSHALLGSLPKRDRWARVLDALTRPPSMASAYLTRRGLFNTERVQQILNPAIWADGHAKFNLVEHITDSVNGNGNLDSFEWVSRAELRNYTHHQLLRDTDVMSMAHSLEVRVPLLDYELVETILNLPTSLKQNGRATKSLLRNTMRDRLPVSVIDRRDKQGFIFPLDVWLRNDLRNPVRGILAEVKQKPWIKPDAVDRAIQQHAEGQIHWSRLWSLIALGCIEDS